MGAAYCGCGQEFLTVALITLAQGFSGLQYAGYVVNHVDIAPKYAGTMYGISNTVAAIFGFLPPAIVATLTPNVNIFLILFIRWFRRKKNFY